MGGKEKVKVVHIGIGSASFGRKMLADLLGRPIMSDLSLHLVLVDTNPRNLDIMTRLARRLKAHLNSSAIVEATGERTQALPGADYVITSVARRRRDLWEQDYRVPFAYGFKGITGENGGPGAAFHALRAFHLILPVCRDIEQLCPDALVLNFSNPESRVLMAMNYLTNLRAVGLCHGQLEARASVAEILDRPLEELDIVGAGMNHFFWFVRIADKRTGEDLQPEVKRRIEADPSLCPALAREMLRIYGLFTFPSDTHIGEYLPFAHEFYGMKWFGRESIPVHAVEPEVNIRDRVPIERMAAYASGERPLDSEATSPSEELTVPIIAAMSHKQEAWVPAVNVLNTEGSIGNVDRKAIVEVPAMVDGDGVHPVQTGDLPEALAAMVNTQVSIQKLLVEAYRRKSRNLLLQALLLDPVVDSVRRAERLIDDMFELQSDFLPKLD